MTGKRVVMLGLGILLLLILLPFIRGFFYLAEYTVSCIWPKNVVNESSFVTEKGTSRCGQKEGKWVREYTDGNRHEEFYKNGKIHGSSKQWSKDGNLWRENVYNMGEFVSSTTYTHTANFELARIDYANLKESPEGKLEGELWGLYQSRMEDPEYISKMALQYRIPAYCAYKDQPPEELAIKATRAVLGAAARLPKGVEVLAIKRSNKVVPRIDGRLAENEWKDALELNIGSSQFKTPFYVMADNEFLYFAANALEDKTETGYDQFRAFFHLNLSDVIKYEIVQVFKDPYRNPKMTSRRDTRVPVTGKLLEKLYEGSKYAAGLMVSDSCIYERTEGASTMDRNRQFEAKIPLSEIGLKEGVPFPLYVEVETDPPAERGKREYVGVLGSQINPKWFVIN